MFATGSSNEIASMSWLRSITRKFSIVYEIHAYRLRYLYKVNYLYDRKISR